MAASSPMHIFNQSECFISAESSYTTLKFVHDIGSRGANVLLVKEQQHADENWGNWAYVVLCS